MEHIPPKGKTVKEYTEQFKVKKNDMPKIIGKTTYSSVKLLLDAVDTNLINMVDDRDII